MSKRDWQKDWEMCQRATPGPWRAEVYAQRIMPYICEHVNSGNAYFIAEAREALSYWLQRVRELEEEVEELCADRNLEKQMRKRSDNRCAELEEELAVWKEVAKRLHKQLLYESRKFYFTVPADLEELAEQMKRYLDEVSVEQFEEDLRKAGIKKCPDIEELAKEEEKQ